MKKTLSEWLSHLETAHTNGLIDMGLERINQVKSNMDLSPKCPVIVVGGTNGKGSTCAFLSQIYYEAGYKVGTLTSPHLLRYNERIAVNCQAVSDEKIIDAFEKIDAARGDISLTYFEFNTLAAVAIFIQENVDVMILEVGLGGRLDAVNIFDADCAVVTSVDLDHQSYLGNTVEQIAYEKAGIFRANVPAIYGQSDAPHSLVAYAQTVGANLWRYGEEFDVQVHGKTWTYHVSGSLKMSQTSFSETEINKVTQTLPCPALNGDYQFRNAACALTAIHCLQARLSVSNDAIEHGLQQVRNIGRLQIIQEKPKVMLDVGHNPHAARALSGCLKTMPHTGRTFAVFSILSDKDSAGVLDILRDAFDAWFIAPLYLPRGMNLPDLRTRFAEQNITCVQPFDHLHEAFAAACNQAEENDRIVVFGSFHTVAEILPLFVSH